MGVYSTQMEQRYAMMALYFGLGSKDWEANWAQPGVSECEWQIVGCNTEKKVADLQMEMGKKRVPDEIGLLSSLRKYIL
jgi:hypothetical protein